MSGCSYYQTEVKCPFYRFDDGRHRVTCEGIMDGSTVSQSYRQRKDFDLQLRIFCCRHYKNCEVFQMLEQKFD